MTSLVFPGQGSQTVGMVKDLYDNFNTAKLIFEEIEDYTKIDLKDIIFENVNNKLNLTQFTQISIFAASYTIFKVFCSETDIDKANINIMLGHSLGEYTALACCDRISLKDCSLILKKRGELMNDAVHPNTTTMAALIGKDSDHIQNLIDDNQYNSSKNLKIYYDFKHTTFNKSYDYETGKVMNLVNPKSFGEVSQSIPKSLQNIERKKISIPARRKSSFKLIGHPPEGYKDGGWKYQSTRLNQIRYYKQILDNESNLITDGLTTLKFKTMSKTEDDNYTFLSVDLGL